MVVGTISPVLSFAAPKSPPPLVSPIQHQPNARESAVEFRNRYGLQKSDLLIEQVEVNDKAAAADGSTYYQIKARALKPGEYILTFEKRDNLNVVFEMRKIRFLVEEGRTGIVESLRTAVLSPEDAVWTTYQFGRAWARLGNPIQIKWSWYSGGEGVPGGWFLAKIEDTSKPTPTSSK